MAPYNTIPQTTPEAEETLLQAQKPKTNLKALVGGAVAASFVLGVLAATAVSSAVAPRTSNLVASSSNYKQIQLDGTNMCLAVQNYHSGIKQKQKVEMYTCKDKADAGKNGQLWEYGSFGQDGYFIKLAGTNWCVDAIGGIKFDDGAHGWFGLYECNYGENQELQFIGEDMPTYIDLSAFPSDSSGEKLVFQPKSCIGKDNCTPPDRDEIVGSSEWPWPEFKLV